MKKNSNKFSGANTIEIDFIMKEKNIKKNCVEEKACETNRLFGTDNRLNLNQVELGKPLPEWSIEALFDTKIPAVKDYLGKPLLVLFFSLGCPGCVGRAIPFANRVVYEKGEEVNVIGIHTNFEGIDFKLEKFVEAQKEFHIRFPFFKDKNYDTTFLNYGAGGTPHWILVDKNGLVEYSIFGSDPNNALLRLDLKFQELLNKN